MNLLVCPKCSLIAMNSYAEVNKTKQRWHLHCYDMPKYSDMKR